MMKNKQTKLHFRESKKNKQTNKKDTKTQKHTLVKYINKLFSLLLTKENAVK